MSKCRGAHYNTIVMVGSTQTSALLSAVLNGIAWLAIVDDYLCTNNNDWR